MYRKRRMPRKRKRAWKRSIRKHRALNQLDLGLRTMMFPANDTISSGSGFQGILEFSAMTNDGALKTAASNFAQELSAIVTQEGLPTTAKINIASYRQDITIANEGATVMEMDIYECIPIKQSNNQSGQQTAVDHWARGYQNSSVIGTLPKLSIIDLGSNPFQSRYFSQHFKILKVRRVYLGTGNCTSWTVSKPANRVINASMVSNFTLSQYIPKVSSVQLCVFKGCPSPTQASSNATVNWNVQTTINYKLEGITENATAVF